MKRTGPAAAVFMLFATLNGCSTHADEENSRTTQISGQAGKRHSASPHKAKNVPPGDMPSWLELYRKKTITGVSTKENVIIVEFVSEGSKEEVYNHYCNKYRNEENFSTSPENHDMVIFVREGYGAKYNLLDESRNIWSLEYHKQTI
jgi:hypothetical protein